MRSKNNMPAKLKRNPFVSGGGLAGTEKVYVIREADREVTDLLRAGRFVQLAEPRQQGKSSLINRLSILLEKSRIIDVKASNYVADPPEQWYPLISGAIYRQAVSRPGLFPRGAKLRPAEDPNQWADFLTHIATLATVPTVIAIDEVALIHFKNSDHFYSVIKNVRDLPKSNLSFILSGCFHPADLVKNRLVSPFNAANRVRLPDFTPNQVLALAQQGPWDDAVASVLSKQVFHWADGHPYVTQYLLSKVVEQGARRDVETAVEEFLQEDTENLPAILRELESVDNQSLWLTLEQILAGERVGVSEALPNSPATRLRLLGVVKPDRDGICQIRNRIYERALRRLQQTQRVFISYRREDDIWAVKLREELVADGVRCFIDRDLKPGQAYPEALQNAIESAACVVLVLNHGSLKDCAKPGDWLRIEVEHALKFNRLVIPVLIKDTPAPTPEMLPPSMRRIADAQTLTLTLKGFPEVAKSIHTAITQ